MLGLDSPKGNCYDALRFEGDPRLDFWKHRNRDLRFILFVFIVSFPFWAPMVRPHFLPCLVVIMVGVAGRVWANGVIQKGQKVCDEGPYSLVRHPMYVNTFLIVGGFLWMWGTWPVRAATMAALLILEIWRAKMEEGRLTGRFAEDYALFKKRVPLAFPYPTTVYNAIKSGALFRGFDFKRLWINGEMFRMAQGAAGLLALYLYYDLSSGRELRFVDVLNNEGVELALVVAAIFLGYALGRSLPHGFAEIRDLMRKRKLAAEVGREAWTQPAPEPAPSEPQPTEKSSA